MNEKNLIEITDRYGFIFLICINSILWVQTITDDKGYELQIIIRFENDLWIEISCKDKDHFKKTYDKIKHALN